MSQMKTYITFIRAMNVGGKNKILTSELHLFCAAIGSKHIETYLHSGNILHDSLLSKEQINKRLAREIEDKLGYHLQVFTINGKELEDLIRNYPISEEVFAKVYCSIFFEPISAERFSELVSQKSNQEAIRFTSKALYIYHQEGYSKSKFTPKFLESKLNCMTTTRNLKTLKILLEMYQKRNSSKL